jgi:hypothetical protein
VEEPTARRAIPGAGGGRSTVDTADREYIEGDERRWFGRREAPPHSSWGVDHSLLQRVEVESFPGPHDQFTVEHAADAQLGLERPCRQLRRESRPALQLVAGFRLA